MIKIFGSQVKDVYELEQARHVLNFDDSLVIIDGRQVRSFDELAQIVTQEKYQDNESVEVVLLPAVEGG
jgi:hypothetical protein